MQRFQSLDEVLLEEVLGEDYLNELVDDDGDLIDAVADTTDPEDFDYISDSDEYLLKKSIYDGKINHEGGGLL